VPKVLPSKHEPAHGRWINPLRDSAVSCCAK
jgi:hypothetical protein